MFVCIYNNINVSLIIITILNLATNSCLFLYVSLHRFCVRSITHYIDNYLFNKILLSVTVFQASLYDISVGKVCYIFLSGTLVVR